MIARGSALGAAAAAALFAVIGPGARAGAADTPSAAPRPGCESRFLQQQLPAGANVQLLVASGNTIPQGAWPGYREMALRVVGCSGEAAQLALRPITGQSFSQRALSTESVPARTGGSKVNPLHYRAELRAFVDREASALDQLQGYPNALNWSDPIGALLAASDAQRLTAPGTKHVVVMVMNGYQQTPEYNIFQYRTDPEKFVEPILRQLREKRAVPQLAGADVVILGITAGASGMQSSTMQVTGLCRFWRAIVQAGQGTMTYCGAGLPDAGRSG
jgi:hypothetical protein